MSIDKCKFCGVLVNTDNEPESYVEMPDARGEPDWCCLCSLCRERWWQDQEALADAAR